MDKISDPMAATLLSVSGAAYGAYASNRLLEKLAEARLQLGEAAFQHWKDHFAQRIQELSAAISEESPELFVSHIRWTRGAFQARGVSVDVLRESLVCLAEVLNEELPEANREVPQQFLDAAIGSLDEPEVEVSSLQVGDEVSTLGLHYLERALDADARGAIKLVVAARQGGMPLTNVYAALMAAQAEVGNLWHSAEVTIAEEHLVTETTKQALAMLSWQEPVQPSNGMTVLAAAVAGNTHDLGIRVVADCFELAGWRSVCLGGNLPSQEIAQAVVTFEATLALLSAAISTQLQALRETIQAIRALDQPCKIMVGGGALSETNDLWRQTGADAFARSPHEALEIGKELVAGS